MNFWLSGFGAGRIPGGADDHALRAAPAFFISAGELKPLPPTIGVLSMPSAPRLRDDAGRLVGQRRDERARPDWCP